jgi:NADH-quinone oxidoreductase subunit C
MDAPTLLAALEPVVGAGVLTAGEATDQPTLVVAPDRLVQVALIVRENPHFDMALLSDVIGVDHLPREPRFDVIYHLASISRRFRLRLKVPVGGEEPHVPTVSPIWRAAGWLEREVWDLFGIVFDEHPDLGRLLMPEDWEGHPLRKDYPVQIKQPVNIFEPLQVSEEEFRARIERDRRARG